MYFANERCGFMLWTSSGDTVCYRRATCMFVDACLLQWAIATGAKQCKSKLKLCSMQECHRADSLIVRTRGGEAEECSVGLSVFRGLSLSPNKAGGGNSRDVPCRSEDIVCAA